jgi:class 3 adenylate cyclase
LSGDWQQFSPLMWWDVVGYSRLVGVDEADALSRLSMLRRDIIEPSIADHSGRLSCL